MAETRKLVHNARPVIESLSSHDVVALSATCLALLWLIYLWALRTTRRFCLNRRSVIGATTAVNLAAFAVPPVYITEIFSYAIFGRIGSVYPLNLHVMRARDAAPDEPVMHSYRFAEVGGDVCAGSELALRPRLHS